MISGLTIVESLLVFPLVQVSITCVCLSTNCGSRDSPVLYASDDVRFSPTIAVQEYILSPSLSRTYKSVNAHSRENLHWDYVRLDPATAQWHLPGTAASTSDRWLRGGDCPSAFRLHGQYNELRHAALRCTILRCAAPLAPLCAPSCAARTAGSTTTVLPRSESRRRSGVFY